MCVETMAEKYGGKVVRTRVGDIYVSEAIKRDGAVFGGEPCGAWVHPQIHLCPDGPLSAALFLKALEDEGKTVSEFIGEVPEYITMRENIVCKNEQKYKLVEKLGSALKSGFPAYTDFSTVDGARLALKNGWLLVRASGTEPLIRLTVEGESQEAAKDITQKATALIHKQVEATVNMKAVLLAAGEGIRLLPITATRPKHLIKVGGKPILQFCLEAVKRAGIDEAIIVTHYMGDAIRSYFGDGEKLGLKLTYVETKSDFGNGKRCRSR